MARRDRKGSVEIDLDPFFKLFALHQRRNGWKWHLADGRKLRTLIDDIPCCPLEAIGWSILWEHEKNSKTILAGRPMEIVRLPDRLKAAVVHHADGIACSRYWQEPTRDKLLRSCGIIKRRKENVFGEEEA